MWPSCVAGRLRTLSAALTALALVCAQGVTATPAAELPPPRATNGGNISANWAGYVVSPPIGRISRVRSTFVVPAIRSALPPGLASVWTGIGGSVSGDLIQAGVAAQTVANPATGQQYVAWYELLPDGQVDVTHCRGHDPSCTVHPGDRMSVDIRLVASGRWSVTMTDARHWTWAKTVAYASTGSSAEWIIEAPALVRIPTILPDLGRVLFTTGNTFTVPGHGTKTIAHGNAVATVVGVPGAVDEAVPSALDTRGDGFAVCTYVSTCSRP